MITAGLLLSPVEAGRGKTARTTATIAATKVACTFCTARTPSMKMIWGMAATTSI
jgi:hypothetical protein